MLIAFTGTHSTGKTTLLNMLKTKRDNEFKDYEFIDEITRDMLNLGFSINELGNDLTQLHIILSHYRNTLKTNAVMDRCVVDGYCYTKYLFEKGSVNSTTMLEAEKSFNCLIDKYDVLFWLKPEFGVVDDGVRSTNDEFRDRVNAIFEDVFKTPRSNVVVLTGTIENRMNQIFTELTKRGFK